MKFAILSLMLMSSLSAFSATVDLDCMGGTLSITNSNEDISVENVQLVQKISVVENDAAIIIIDNGGMRLITAGDVTAADDGKSVILISQNIDPDDSAVIGLNVTNASIDLSTENGIVMKNLTQHGKINQVDFVTIDFEAKRFLKCQNSL